MNDKTTGSNHDQHTSTGNGPAAMFGDVAHDLATKGKEAIGAAKEVAHDAKEKIVDVKDKVVDRGLSATSKVRKLAMDNPVKTVLIGLAVGYVGLRAVRRWRA